MAFVEFYMRPSSGSDLNSGSTSSDVGGGSDAAIYTSTGGNFDGTNTFTPTDNSTPASTISAGMYASLYNTGDAAARCIALINTVNAGVNGTIIIDGTIKYGTVPTVNSGSRNIKVGGSLASLGILAANAAFNTGAAPQATRVNVKAGTYSSTTTSRGFGLTGAATAPLIWRGYKVTPGDQDANNVPVKGTDIPDFTSTSGLLTIGGTQQVHQNISYTCSGAITVGVSGTNVRMIRCLVESTGAFRAINVSAGNLIGTLLWLKAPTTASSAISFSAGNSVLNTCIVVGGTNGVNAAAGVAILENCLIDSPSTDGIAVSGSNTFVAKNCSIYGAGGTSGNGINISVVPTTFSVIANNYIENFNGSGKFAITNSSGTNTSIVNLVGNAYYNNTANRNGFSEDVTFFDNGTLASQGFTNPGSQDFSMQAVGQNIGVPGLFQGTNVYRGWLDVGAVQHLGQQAGGVSGAIMMVRADRVYAY